MNRLEDEFSNSESRGRVVIHHTAEPSNKASFLAVHDVPDSFSVCSLGVESFIVPIMPSCNSHLTCLRPCAPPQFGPLLTLDVPLSSSKPVSWRCSAYSNGCASAAGLST